MHVVQLVVETTCIADGVACLVPSPQGCGGGAAVGADQRLLVDLVLVEGRAASARRRPARAVTVAVAWA